MILCGRCSSMVRALDCGSRGCGFEPRHLPHIFCNRHSRHLGDAIENPIKAGVAGALKTSLASIPISIDAAPHFENECDEWSKILTAALSPTND
jgi:hypothetical protein